MPKSKSKPKPSPTPPASIISAPPTPLPTTLPPSRKHVTSYHHPLLLSDLKTCNSLLSWFASVSENRRMPWRQQWIDPAAFEGTETELKTLVAKRAYEVWVSEVMLQQTRVAVAIPYFNSWISKWPTVQDLALATHDDVLAVWSGLGYYSRATRLHQAAQALVQQSAENDECACLIPESLEDLLQIPGVGKYTAGAISSIAFGNAVAVLDGNVERVLSRQVGLYGDGKGNKGVKMLWEVAERLVKHVSSQGVKAEVKSVIPGQWNQALMELGSTVCILKPKCDECPIRATCRAYAEGKALLARVAVDPEVSDIEDSCSHCVPIDTEDLEATIEDDEDQQAPGSQTKNKKKRKRKPEYQISKYFSPIRADRASSIEVEDVDGVDTSRSSPPGLRSSFIPRYCSLFPKKGVKKIRPEEEYVVCIIESRCVDDQGSKWLIEQRPAKGLLASLWQFPLIRLPSSSTLTTPPYTNTISNHLPTLGIIPSDTVTIHSIISIGNETHLLTHRKLIFHVHPIVIRTAASTLPHSTESDAPLRKLVAGDAMEGETLSTGMRKCWKMYQQWIDRPRS